MKIFTCFLNICLLVLSCISCEDFTDFVGADKLQDSISIEQNKNHAIADNCSPLCTCNCCGQPLAFSLKSSKINIVKQERMDLNSPEYISSFASDYLNTIWQPPKMKMNVLG
ncbi:hypothetical protein [Pedobacter lithocola]|uniref:hypothetical protein n=1 Tax=Pedobacter lithocola TaxID=1908239 RepID=UPI0036719477